MRRLKHKHTRRAIQFYEINYGFRKPYKVIAKWLLLLTLYGSTASNASGHDWRAGNTGWKFCARPERDQVRDQQYTFRSRSDDILKAQLQTTDVVIAYENSMGDPAEILAKLLGVPVKCYVTRCSLLELKGLGAPFSGNAIHTNASVSYHDLRL